MTDEVMIVGPLFRACGIDGELPQEAIKAIEVFNATISQLGPVSWYPSQFAADLY